MVVEGDTLTVTKPQTASLIDTINQGYAAINRHIWVLLVPILLNAYLWYGAQISFRPLIDDFTGLMRRLQSGSPYQSELQIAYDQWSELGNINMQQPLAVLNFIPTLTMYVVDTVDSAQQLPLPVVLPPRIDQQRTVIEIGDISIALLLFLVVNALLLPISAAFLSLVAEAVRGDGMSLGLWLRRSGRATLSILGYVGVIVGAMIAVGVPLTILAMFLSLISPAFVLFLAGVLQIAAFWIGIYIGFAPEAIVVSGVGPLQALRASFNLVRRNFWGTLLLLGVSFIITVGTGVIWSMIAGSTAGLIGAIIGSAYIGSGLLAARMAFYRERLRRWHATAGAKV